jgi:hypothetical protein
VRTHHWGRSQQDGKACMHVNVRREGVWRILGAVLAALTSEVVKALLAHIDRR